MGFLKTDIIRNIRFEVFGFTPLIKRSVICTNHVTKVNEFPCVFKVALVFLTDLKDGHPPNRLQTKLRLCFKDFSKKCTDALRKNKNLIGPDQRDYQKELERNHHKFTEGLAPLMGRHRPQSMT